MAAVDLSAEQKREIIQMLSQQYPIVVICQALGWARSTYYHPATANDDTALRQAIEAVVAEWPTYGYRRVTHQLQRPEGTINHIWVCDITYVRVRWEFISLAVIMDVFTRGLRGWGVGRSLDHHVTLSPLKQALAHPPAPEIDHSDQGVQSVASSTRSTCINGFTPHWGL